MANILYELPDERTIGSKSFLLDNGSVATRSYGGAVHYQDTTGTLQDIVLSYAEEGTQHVASSHYMSNGYRKDLKYMKMWGLRYRTAGDVSGANLQYEMTPNSVEIDGVEQLSGTEFTAMSVVGNKATHTINASTSYVHELRWSRVVGYVKVDTAPSDFKLLEEIHLRGFYCTNVKNGDEYAPDTRGNFNFARSDNDEFIFAIKSPMMWDEKAEGEIDQVSFGVQHRLYHVAGPKVIYEKTPTAEGQTWLSSAVGAVSIDTTTEFPSSDSDGWMDSGIDTNWTTLRSAATATVNDTTTTLEIREGFVSTFFAIYRGYTFHDISATGSDTINSAKFVAKVQSQSATAPASVHIQETTSPDPMDTGSYGDIVLDTGSFGSDAVGANGTLVEIDFNAAGITYIDGTTTPKFCIRAVKDYDDVVPTEIRWVRFHSNEATTEADRPFLEVVHTEAAGGIAVLRRRME